MELPPPANTLEGNTGLEQSVERLGTAIDAAEEASKNPSLKELLEKDKERTLTIAASLVVIGLLLDIGSVGALTVERLNQIKEAGGLENLPGVGHALAGEIAIGIGVALAASGVVYQQYKEHLIRKRERANR